MYTLNLQKQSIFSYRTTLFNALSLFSATPRLVRHPKTKKCIVVRPLF